MKISFEQELFMKKSILYAIENNYSMTQLADHFGVSKSTIYKYRRHLRDQGFIKKNENGIYFVVNNKFSKRLEKSQIPQSDLTPTIEKKEIIEKVKPQKDCIQLELDMKIRTQNKLQSIRDEKKLEKYKNTGFLTKILRKFKK